MTKLDHIGIVVRSIETAAKIYEDLVQASSSHSATGWWTNGCGGSGCDDNVQGYTVISGNKIGVLLHSSGGFKVASLKHVTITGSGADGLQLFGANLYANVTESIISGNAGSAANAAFSGTTVNIDRSTIANNATGLTATSGAIIRASGNNIYNNATGFSIGAGAFIQSDSTNNTGGSNGGLGAPNASLAKN